MTSVCFLKENAVFFVHVLPFQRFLVSVIHVCLGTRNELDQTVWLGSRTIHNDTAHLSRFDITMVKVANKMVGVTPQLPPCCIAAGCSPATEKRLALFFNRLSINVFNRLRMFMQIYIIVDIIKGTEANQRFLSLVKYRNECFIS